VIGLDTNILVRYLSQDDAKQSVAASRLIEAPTPESPGLITTIVLAETVWVMEELYGARREQIASIVENLLQADALLVQDAEQAWAALSRYRGGVADFADYLIERTCASLGCETVYTFDRKAARARDCGMMLVA
jgi:predicted nucleic-acid-binding protein